MMTPKTKFLKLALYNAGSLGTGHDDFIVAMNRFGPDIVAINETWLPAGQEARAPTVPGYKLTNAPRPRRMRGGRGGGVAFYVRRDLRVRFVKHPAADIEQLWLYVQLSGLTVAIGTAYRPPWLDSDVFIDALTESVTFFSKYDYVVLMGDFNINMLNDGDNKVVKMCQFLSYLDLEQVVTEPTHRSVNADTLIDLVCTNCKVCDIKVCSVTGSLGHSMVNLTVLLRKPKVLPKIRTYRSLKNIDLVKFNQDLLKLDWETVSLNDTVEEMVDCFNAFTNYLLDLHAPLVTKKIKPNCSLPWVTDMIKYMMELRNEAHDRYRSTKSDTHKKYYKDLKALVNTSIYYEKRAYYDYYINQNVNTDSKQFWRNIKQKLLQTPHYSETLPDCFGDANVINDHFLKVPGPEDVPDSQIDYFKNHCFATVTPPFKLNPVNELELFKCIKTITSNATGCDGISRDMVLLTLPHTISVITNIVNKSIASGVFPPQWKKALVTPLPKIDEPKDLKDLRPISILPFLSKLLEKVVYTQLMDYVERNKILPSHQSGFRRGRSTTTALLDVTDNILADQDAGRGTLLALLDFSRAFDSLNLRLLLAKMSFYKFDPHTIAWFASYLGDRSQSVRLQREDGSFSISEPKMVRRGVPQGSILGPLLFAIYSADLPLSIVHSRYHCYADDLQVYISGKPTEIGESAHKLNDDLDAIATWSSNNALTLNASKSKFMILGTRKQTDIIIQSVPAVRILGAGLERVNEARNLGITFDSNLRFENHILNVVRSCFYRLKVLYKFRKLLSEKSRITLCESLVLSRLNYGDLVYGPRLLCKTKRMIQRVQNACCRFCFDIPPRSHISPFLSGASMLNMESRRRLHMAVLMFDLTSLNNPDYLYQKLKFSDFHDRYGSGVPRQLRVPLAMHVHKTVGFTGSFRYQATKCWNNVPPPIRAARSKYSFKNQFKTFLIDLQKTEVRNRFGGLVVAGVWKDWAL